MGAVKGGALGGAIGGALPVAGSVAKTALSPVISNVLARVDPEGSARARLARALSESGMTAGQVGDEVSNAANAGQGVYTVMDAMGNPGQRLASTVARAPGEGRTQMVEFLNDRQAGQGARVGEQIDTALGTGPTAKQSAADLVQQGADASRPLYEQAMKKGPVWDNRIQEFLDEPILKQGLATGVKMQRLEALAKGEKFNPHDYAITDFDAAGDPIISGVPNMRTLQAAKIGLDNLVEQHTDPVTGRMTQMGRAINGVRKSFLDKLNSYNPAYAEANAAYAGPAQIRDAIETGQQAATRGRAADNLDTFGKLNPPSQQGYRIGYADTLQNQIERGAEGRNAVRPLTSEKARTELGALSLHNGPYMPGQADTLQQRLAREMQMFETRNAALGGSKTADNLADEAAAGIDPRIFWNALHGNFMGAAANAVHAGKNVLSGNTPAVRSEMAKLLMARGNNADMKPMLLNLEQELARKQALAAGLSRGLVDATGQQAGQRR